MTDKLNPSDLDELREVMKTGDKLVRLSYVEEFLVEAVHDLIKIKVEGGLNIEISRLKGTIDRAVAVVGDSGPMVEEREIIANMLAILRGANQ